MPFWLLVVMFICSFAGAVIGRVKNRPLLGAVLGAFLGIIGLLIISALPAKQPEEETYDCPACGEKVKLLARICPHCRTPLRSVK
jgi:uncharacterized membrane protein YfcA